MHSIMIYLILWCLTSCCIIVQAEPIAPFVVLPPSLRINALNTIIVSPVKSDSENADIHLRVLGFKDRKSSIIFTQKLKAKRAGASHSFSFQVTDPVEKAKVSVDVQGHTKFESEIRVLPNLAALHIHTDKPIYSAGETVSVRALPLTYEGSVYDGFIEFALVNPDGFELVRKRNNTSDGYIPLTFELPEYLFYGEWHIIAKPQGVNDADLTYSVAFQVKDYVLPPFKIGLSISDGQPLNSTEVTVESRYYYGAPLSGSLTFYCNTRRNRHSSKPQRLMQSLITDGLWKQSVNLSICFSSSRQTATVITVEIRDRGSGNRGEAAITFDPLYPGFEIVPLRPVYNARTKELLLKIDSVGAPVGSHVDVIFYCLGDVMQKSNSTETLVGNVLSFEKPVEWNKCNVIMAEATRHIGTTKTRKKTLMLPMVADQSALEPSWIEIESLRAAYYVGESLNVSVQGGVASRSLNYVILCNLHSVTGTGQVRDDGVLTVKITRKMIGTCILFVYALEVKPTTDMFLFNVVDPCQVSAFVSRDYIEPRGSLSLTLNGEPYGIAIVRAMDDRLNALRLTNDAIRTKYWDFGMFHPDAKSNQARLLNFIALKQLKKTIEQSCSLAASSYLQQFGKCPDAKSTLSVLSNFCLKVMVLKCMNPAQPAVAVSTACDAKNPRNCVYPIRQGKPMLGRVLSLEAAQAPDDTPNMFSDTLRVDDDDRSGVRERFHEVWLFDAIPLTASGTASKTLKAPDTVGTWSVSSAFWSPGQRDLCAAKNIEIISKKDVFLEVDLPKSVFVNETVTAKVTVVALNIERETTYSVCLSDMSRKICADLGSFGQLGQPSYSRVVVSPEHPIDTKTFSLRFLSTGSAKITFQLREETSYPGKHHCDIGHVYDSVRLNIFIAKRDETEELYKMLILDANKPLTDITTNSVVDEITTSRDVFHVTERRSPKDGDVMITDVFANIPDSDAVYSFNIDVSKFLPLDTPEIKVRRTRRSIESNHAFLSDILKRLSVELYQFKRIRILQTTDASTLEMAENRIGSCCDLVISDMLRFSDCRNESACGYAEFMMPRNPEERSIALTAIATSLLCESTSDSRLVCGGIQFLIQSFMKEWQQEFYDLSDLVALGHPIDREWFLKAVLLQVSRDCAAYHCVKDDDAWFKLLFSFYSIDENWKWDVRSIAALAYMGTNATSEVMRIRMAGLANRHILPFWNAGTRLFSKTKMSNFEESSLVRKMKSGDILVNSLGILAFVSPGAEGRDVDWDPLASWLYEQQSQDGTYDNVIDTYFASRALFEYHFRKIDISNKGGVTVSVHCPTCEPRTVNVTEAATQIYLPTNVRNVTVETKGHGKAKLDMRLVAKKRQRSRRGLTQDDYHPVRLNVHQERIRKGTIRQTVCLRVLSPLIKVIEITHGLYTGYSATPNSVALLANSSSLSFNSPVTVSSFAAHFVLSGFKHNEILCYVIGVTEPQHSHEPLHLAPVAITARHPVEGVIGLLLISHPDQDTAKRRNRRHMRGQSEVSHGTIFHRIPRAIVDESIDTVCFDGGQCSCAESTCGVKCGLCTRDNVADIKKFISLPQNFGALLRIRAIDRILVNNAYYTHLSTEVREKRGAAEHQISEKLDIWLRECNPRCVVQTPSVNDSYLILGEAGALSVDNSGRQHYVLRNMDRFERATTSCAQLSNAIILE